MRWLAFLAAGLIACSELEAPSGRSGAPLEVRVEPVGELGAAPAVVRLRAVGAAARASVRELALFEGELSSYYLRRLAEREPPATLTAREVPVLAWTEGADVVVAPTRALAAGAYSLATPTLGLLAEVTVEPALVPMLERIWPPAGEQSGNGFALFCGDAAGAASEGYIALAPAGVSARLLPGVDGHRASADRCVGLEPTEVRVGVPELPPALAGGVALEPSLLVPDGQPSNAPGCEDGEQPLGPACASIDDDRLLVRAPVEPSLWAIDAPEPLLGVSAPGARLVVHGLEPGTPVAFRATAVDRAGVTTPLDLLMTGALAHAHVVINEVLANPRGPEGTSEWIELVNDGRIGAELEGYELRDAGGTVVLPPAHLEPGGFLLLAGAGFEPDPELDVPPVPGTRVVVLPKLGQGGLSNAGELLRLSDTSGRVLSRFPALAAPEAGVSLARRAPDACDDDSAAFGAHAAPGASPGAPNVLATPR